MPDREIFGPVVRYHLTSGWSKNSGCHTVLALTVKLETPDPEHGPEALVVARFGNFEAGPGAPVGYATTDIIGLLIILELPRDELPTFWGVVREVPDRNHRLLILLDENNRVVSCQVAVDEFHKGDTEKDRRDRLESMQRFI